MFKLIMQKIIQFLKPTKWKIGIYIFFIFAILFCLFGAQDCQPFFSSELFLFLLIFLCVPAVPVFLLLLIFSTDTINVGNPFIIIILLIYYYIFVSAFLIKLRKVKYPLLFVVLSILLAWLFVFILSSFPGFKVKPAHDSHIISAISQIRMVVSYESINSKHFDKINCENQDMKSLCSDIVNSGSTLFIAHDKLLSSQAVCIYAPLSSDAKKPTGLKACLQERGFLGGVMALSKPKIHSWYCADSRGYAGHTLIDPGSSGFCVDGISAQCPLTSD